ncbi:hypothetical protein DFH27DRAFT_477557 [Peziza echinospora]|nr:hypothetical protein DFH27DRAFT_477557 [Peziza echinospora]
MANTLFNLTGKTALVTGGSRGLGSSMAIGLAEAGADIILVQRNVQNTDTRDHIRSLGRVCHTVVCDLGDIAATRQLVPKILRFGLGIELAGVPNGAIHILLNAAGIQARHPSHLFPLGAFQGVLDTNLTVPFILSRDIARYWIQHREEGRRKEHTIINICSLLSSQGGLTVPAYSASKGGLTQLTKAMSNEFSKHGIRVNAIAPGYCATDMNTALIGDETRSRQIMERIPMGRWGGGEDFKGVVVFLASERASGYVTGETVTVDGGWMAR